MTGARQRTGKEKGNLLQGYRVVLALKGRYAFELHLERNGIENWKLPGNLQSIPSHYILFADCLHFSLSRLAFSAIKLT